MDLRNIISERHVLGNNDIDKSKEIIHIAFGIDENFTLGMGVLITSILLHNPNKIIDFHIFTDQLKQIDIERLTEVAKKYDNCQIHTYYVDGEKLKELPAWYIWTLATWYRFLTVIELYEKVDYLWYMDADILCVQEIINPVLDPEMILGACGEEIHDKKEQNRLKRFLKTSPYRNFNAGVLYIDTKQWMKNNTSNKAIEGAIASPDDYGGLDNDALLAAVQQQWQYIDDKYNYVYNLVADHTAIPNDKIFVHFAGTCKPWQSWGQDNDITALWNEYKNKSEWKDVPVQTPKTYRQAKFMLKMMKRSNNILGSIKWYILYAVYKIREKL